MPSPSTPAAVALQHCLGQVVLNGPGNLCSSSLCAALRDAIWWGWVCPLPLPVVVFFTFTGTPTPSHPTTVPAAGSRTRPPDLLVCY